MRPFRIAPFGKKRLFGNGCAKCARLPNHSNGYRFILPFEYSIEICFTVKLQAQALRKDKNDNINCEQNIKNWTIYRNTNIVKESDIYCKFRI